MLVEEFNRCIQYDVKSFLDEKQVESLEEAARLADDYSFSHKTPFRIIHQTPLNQFNPKDSSGNSRNQRSKFLVLSQLILLQKDNIISDCLKLKRNKQQLSGEITLHLKMLICVHVVQYIDSNRLAMNQTAIYIKRHSFQIFSGNTPLLGCYARSLPYIHYVIH